MIEIESGPYRPPLRLYVVDDLKPSAIIGLGRDQSHYLQHVMRRGPGDKIALFNGRDGEWAAVIGRMAKTGCEVQVEGQIRPQITGPDIWLAFAPVKRDRLDFLVQKAVELGASALKPVMTRYTVVERVKAERMMANAIEAAEQCGRLDVPVVDAPVPFHRFLESWPSDRHLFFCDEAGDALPLATAVAGNAGPAAILIGPEGGFHPAERSALRAKAGVTPVALGPRILRSDTAAMAALSIWQSLAGDWRSSPA